MTYISMERSVDRDLMWCSFVHELIYQRPLFYVLTCNPELSFSFLPKEVC